MNDKVIPQQNKVHFVSTARESVNSGELLTRGGIFYARIYHASAGEFLEVALHGVCNEEEARCALQFLLVAEGGLPVCL